VLLGCVFSEQHFQSHLKYLLSQLRDDEPVPELDDNEQTQGSAIPPVSSDALALDPDRPVSMRFLFASFLNSLMLCNLAYDDHETFTFTETLFIIIHHFILIISSVDFVRKDPDTGVTTRTAFYIHDRISYVIRSTLATKIFVGLMFVLAVLVGIGAGFSFDAFIHKDIEPSHRRNEVLYQGIMQTIEGLGLLGAGVYSSVKIRREGSKRGGVTLEEEQILQA